MPPPYPYDRLNELKIHGDRFDGGLIDLSIGTPKDPPAPVALAAMAATPAVRGYPPSIGFAELRAAGAAWLNREFGSSIGASSVASTIGTKEFVVSTPKFLHLRRPDLDTVLYPALSYPSYAMGAELAGLRAIPVPVDDEWRLNLDGVDRADVARALCLWISTPGNPAGQLEDLSGTVEWAREHDITLISDECYIEFTWERAPGAGPADRLGATVLAHSTENVLALHSLSKRSNFAGARYGFYAGDPDLVHYLSELRKHSGYMVPGPVQHAAIAALSDQSHVDVQRERYRSRLAGLADVLTAAGLDVGLPQGGFYLWVPAPEGDAWALVARLAEQAGVLASPGEFYGQAGAGHVRFAVVESDERLALIGDRLAASGGL